MCRFAAYLGPGIFISSLVTKPSHSIIHQSYNAKERIELLNGDGFGIGWYAPQFCRTPALFKDVSPAWSNQNLKDIARVTKSSCIFAHVRAATIGGQSTRAKCRMDEGSDAVLVVSEPLSSSSRWQKIGNNYLVTVDRDRSISVQSMQEPT